MIILIALVAGCDEYERKEIVDGGRYIVGAFSHVEYDEAGYWYEGKTFVYLQDRRAVVLEKHRTAPVKKGEIVRFVEFAFDWEPCDKWGNTMLYSWR
jgi:hypothetical protein